MSRLGIGPLLASVSISYFLSTVTLSLYFAPAFHFFWLADTLRIGIAASFISVGIALYVAGVHAMLYAYRDGRLCTTGVFALCRHPIYSAWICFLVPGMSFWANSWLSFTTPLVMYALFRRLIRKEDRYLQERFGAEYLLYRKNTPELLPFGWVKRARG